MRRILFHSLVRRPLTEAAPVKDEEMLAELGAGVERAARRRLGRSLSIREVDAGSCNGCELEIHALNNAFYDLERFGLHFVASPRHADVLLVTGRSPGTCARRLSARIMLRRTPNGWSRSETVRWTAVFFPTATRSSGGFPASYPSICIFAAARHARRNCSRGC